MTLLCKGEGAAVRRGDYQVIVSDLCQFSNTFASVFACYPPLRLLVQVGDMIIKPDFSEVTMKTEAKNNIVGILLVCTWP